MKTIYDTNKHSVFFLNYHLIFTIKSRRKIIDNKIYNRLKEIFENIAKNSNYQLKIIKLDYDLDYLHIFFKAQPKSMLSSFINAYKSASSKLIKKEFPDILTKLDNKKFWSQSYFLVSTGEITLKMIEEYIKNQGIEDNRIKKKYKKKDKKC